MIHQISQLHTDRRAFLVGGTLSLCPVLAKAAPTSIAEMISSFTDQRRRRRGLRTLSVSNRLGHAANNFAHVLAHVEEFSHTADGQDLSERAYAASYRFRRLGENIGWTTTAREEAIARDLVRRWMASPGHRANILNPRFKDIGIGVTQTRGRTYAVQIFGTKA